MYPTIGMARDHHDAYLRSHRSERRWTDRRNRRVRDEA